MTESILYVEDEIDYQLLVLRILGKVGFHIQVAVNGQDGFMALQQSAPALLILDVNLPDTDGYTLCRRVRQNPIWTGLPILLLTVRRRPEEWLQGFSCGASDYVPKPINPPELVERIQSCLSGKQREHAGRPEYLLVKAGVSGNRAAFEVLVHQYKGRLIDSLRAWGRSTQEAEDIASTAFIQAYQRLHYFRGQSSFYTWLYRIAMNELLHQKRRKLIVSLEGLTRRSEIFWPAKFAGPDRVEDRLSTRALHAQVHRAVAYIPRPYRQMLKWHFVAGLSCKILAKRLKIPAGTVMSRLFKAKQLLRQAWNRVDPSPAESLR